MLSSHSWSLQTADGLSLHIHHWSVATPRWVLLCVQGLGGHGAYYDELAAQLADTDPAIVAPDLRGHGLSQGVRGHAPSFQPFLSDIHELLTQTRLKYPAIPLVLLGESMGAALALNYLGKYRPPIDGLILVSPVLKPVVTPTLSEVATFLSYALINPRKPVLI